jgi:large subunit ribosomal protein L4
VDNDNLRLSCKNLQQYQVIAPIGVNVYDVLRYDHLIVTRRAVEAIEKRLLGEAQ